LALAFTDGTVYKPAELTGLKFPSRAMFAALGRAFFYGPAGFKGFVTSSASGEQKKNLPLHMGWDLAPPLLIAVDRFCRDTQKFGHFFLGFV
jgi:hypothetical protein